MNYLAQLRENAVFRRVVAAVRDGGPAPVVIGGLAPGAAPLFVAALYRELEAPLLAVLPTPERAAAFAADAGVYAGAEPLTLEAPGVIPLKPVSPPLDVAAARVRTLLALGEEGTPWCVASAAAVGRRLPPPGELARAVRVLRPGDELALDEVEAHLVLVGYERVGTVEGPAQFARRGALLDLMPPGSDTGFRVELFGDRVETIRQFDIWTQRRGEAVPELIVRPPRELVLTPAAITRAVGVIRERFGEDAAADAYEALDLYRYMDGVENLIPFLYAEAATVADYFKTPPMVVAVDYDAAAAALEAGPPPAGAPAFPYPAAAEVLVTWDELAAAVTRRGGRLVTAAVSPLGNGLDFRSRGVDHVAGRPDLFADEARAFSRRGVAVVTVERPEQLTGFEETMGAHLHGVPLRYECRPIQEGFSWDEAGVALFPAWRVLRRRPPVRRRRVPRFAPGDEAVRVGSPFELTPGDLVIHVDHGLGRFEGLTRLAVEGHEEEFLQLTYAEDGRLYVPVYNLKLVHRYVGGDASARPLDRLGGGEWRRARRRARRAAEKLARALLELYAARAAREGHRFAGDATWEQELAESFPYAETPDQLRAVDDVLADMAGPRPMERLVCGDVGFGKTEVAVRAALRAVADGKQVAVLVPTTILADQHYATFRERLAAFPVRVEMLSRFRTSRESKAVVAEIAAGRVDVVVGTHRLLSRDVAFANLGLLIVDEEQRFGVAQKEKIKRLSVTVDVLILTATPIPRTLHMALAGLRDLSLIGTAPLERLPIRTTVAPFDEDLIADAVTRELARGGQVFFVHNRVRTIDAVAAYLRDLVPAARFDVAHGQLPERELERIMHDFARRRFDVLVSSAIIEAGLDFPNVNTIIVNRADTFGLSQLHQLRGRVGRSHLRAYAYFLTPPSHALADAARQRLQALREATELGAGFRLAMRDLEIRGAGNLLGPEQSGAVAAVGLDLYTQLLGDAVAALKGEERAPEEDVTVHLDEDAFLPPGYVPDEGQRLNLYRRLSDAASEAAVARLADELADRFGPPPAPVARLFNVRRIRFYGRAAGFTDVNIRGAELTVTFAPGEFERSAARAAPPGVAAAKVRSRAGRVVVTFTVEPPAAADEAALALARAWAGR